MSAAARCWRGTYEILANDGTADSPLPRKCGSYCQMGLFQKFDKAVDRFGYWVTAYVIMSGGLASIAQRMQAFQIGWPEAILIGIVLSAFIMLALSAGLAGWRYFKPLTVAGPPTDFGSVIEGDRIGEIPNGDPDVGSSLSRVYGLLNFQYETQSNQVKELLGRILQLENEGNKRHGAELAEMKPKLEKMIAFQEQGFRNLDQRFAWVDQGFRALMHRERLTELGLKITRGAEVLLAPSKGEKLSDLDKWKDVRKEWRADLRSWCEIAEIYSIEGNYELVSLVPPSNLEGNWPEEPSLFPGTDAIVAYRSATLTYENFCKARDKVHECVVRAAYVSPSRKGLDETPNSYEQRS